MTDFPTPAIIMSLEGKIRVPKRFEYDGTELLRACLSPAGFREYLKEHEKEKMSRHERFWRSAMFVAGKWRDGTIMRPGMSGEEYLAQMGAKHGAETERIREESGRTLRDAGVGGRGARAASAPKTKKRAGARARQRKNGAGSRGRVRTKG